MAENIVSRPHDLFAYLPKFGTGRVLDLGPLINGGKDRILDPLERLQRRSYCTEQRDRRSGTGPVSFNPLEELFHPPARGECRRCMQEFDWRKHAAGNAQFVNSRPHIEDTVKWRIFSAPKDLRKLPCFAESGLAGSPVGSGQQAQDGRLAGSGCSVSGHDAHHFVEFQNAEGMLIHKKNQGASVFPAPCSVPL